MWRVRSPSAALYHRPMLRRRLLSIGGASLAIPWAAPDNCGAADASRPVSEVRRRPLLSLQTRMELERSEIDTEVQTVVTLGYYAPGDRGGSTYLRAASPSPGSARSADGALWALAPEIIRPEQFGARGNGRDDDTIAFQAALSFSEANRNRTIVCAAATYCLSRPLRVRQGTTIRGEGSQGSTADFGAVFGFNGEGDGFVFDGSGAAYAGTGGGIRDAQINRGRGSHGGAAIRVLAQDDDHRPGEMVFDNVLVLALPGSTWSNGLVVDGSRAGTPGTRGVRDVYLRKFRVSGATDEVRVAGQTVGRSIWLRQVTHLGGTDVVINQGGGARVPGLVIEGISDSVMFTNADIDGTLHLSGPALGSGSVSNFYLSGKISGAILQEDPNVNGLMELVTPKTSKNIIRNASAALKVVSPQSPFFSVGMKANRTKWPLNHEADLLFDLARYDTGNNWSAGLPNSTYVAYCAGPYVFSAAIMLGLGGAEPDGHAILELIHQGHEDRRRTVSQRFSMLGGDRVASLRVDYQAILDVGDRLKVNLGVFGTRNPVSLLGGEGGTSFDGRYTP